MFRKLTAILAFQIVWQLVANPCMAMDDKNIKINHLSATLVGFVSRILIERNLFQNAQIPVESFIFVANDLIKTISPPKKMAFNTSQELLIICKQYWEIPLTPDENAYLNCPKEINVLGEVLNGIKYSSIALLGQGLINSVQSAATGKLLSHVPAICAYFGIAMGGSQALACAINKILDKTAWTKEQRSVVEPWLNMVGRLALGLVPKVHATQAGVHYHYPSWDGYYKTVSEHQTAVLQNNTLYVEKTGELETPHGTFPAVYESDFKLGQVYELSEERIRLQVKDKNETPTMVTFSVNMGPYGPQITVSSENKDLENQWALNFSSHKASPQKVYALPDRQLDQQIYNNAYSISSIFPDNVNSYTYAALYGLTSILTGGPQHSAFTPALVTLAIALPKYVEAFKLKDEDIKLIVGETSGGKSAIINSLLKYIDTPGLFFLEKGKEDTKTVVGQCLDVISSKTEGNIPAEKVRLYINVVQHVNKAKNLPVKEKTWLFYIIAAAAFRDKELIEETSSYVLFNSGISHFDSLLRYLPDDMREAFEKNDFSAIGKEFIDYYNENLKLFSSVKIDEFGPLAFTKTDDDIPVGAVVVFPASSIPKGYLKCDGSWQLKSEYKELYAVLRESCEENDHSFRVPDYKGMFLRGVENPSDIGESYEDSTKMPNTPFKLDASGHHRHTTAAASGHTHKMDNAGDHDHDMAETKAKSYTINNVAAHTNTLSSEASHTPDIVESGEHTHNIIGGDEETCPKHIMVAYLIKAKPTNVLKLIKELQDEVAQLKQASIKPTIETSITKQDVFLILVSNFVTFVIIKIYYPINNERQ